MANEPLEVIPGKKWAVKRQKGKKSIKNFENKAEAVEFARKLAKKNKTQLLIKKQNGQIQEERSYGNDPYPPEG
jgi:hypothetical protein